MNTLKKFSSVLAIMTMILIASIAIVPSKSEAALNFLQGLWRRSGNVLIPSPANLGLNLTQGGGLFATSTVLTSATLLQFDLVTYSTISMISNTGNLTLTLPATSTLTTFAKNAGDFVERVFINASTTATTTFAAGTGMTLQYASTTPIGPTKSALLRFIRKANTDMIVQINLFN